jgi:hypothetical protein
MKTNTDAVIVKQLNKEIIKPIKPEECDNLAKSNLAGFNKFK